MHIFIVLGILILVAGGLYLLFKHDPAEAAKLEADAKTDAATLVDDVKKKL